ncbi:hypothetical protein JOB18_039905 [Solea senegalensis]|uniref:Uncharacterized protein n=1 Tax=Solea senegalensis TaxID=28829 RepID=A0AAV6SI34_SOLSE|nr:hypothetical protein JOB18_039905 [Solea senegalensis]
MSDDEITDMIHGLALECSQLCLAPHFSWWIGSRHTVETDRVRRDFLPQNCKLPGLHCSVSVSPDVVYRYEVMASS